jgi:glycosyltransferase involved in cell wall biosynthesis
VSGLRIGLVIGAPMRAGAERQALRLARALVADGNVVDVVAIEAGDDDVVKEFTEAGATICVFGADVSSSTSRPAVVSRLATHLRRAKTDFVVPFCRLPNIAGALAWRAGGARACVWNQRDAGLGLDGRVTQSIAFAAASHVVSNSLHAIAMLKDRFPLDGRTPCYVPNISERERPLVGRDTWRARLAVARSAPLAVLVSNLTRSKAVELAIDAWSRVVRVRSDAVLAIAGYRGDASADVDRVVAKCGVHDSVRFAGRVTDIAGLIDAADIGFFATRSEGCPGFLLELGEASKPWVSIDVAGVRELTPFGLEHRLARDVNSLGTAALALLDETPEVRAREGECHRRLVTQQFCVDRGLAAWKHLFASVE